MDKTTVAKNVLGGKLAICCRRPMTGFYRDGSCNTGPHDYGMRTVCAVMTKAFLEYSGSCGNDLSTPLPEFNFPRLKPGVCEPMAGRSKGWTCTFCKLESTHERTLEIVDLKILQLYELAIGN